MARKPLFYPGVLTVCMILSVTMIPNERHQQSPNFLIKIPIYE